MINREKLFTWPPAVFFWALVCALLWGSAASAVTVVGWSYGAVSEFFMGLDEAGTGHSDGGDN